MAGCVLCLVPPTTFDYSYLAANQSITIQVAERIDVTEWEEATLIARLHPGSTFPSGTSATIRVLADGFTPDTPQTLFQSSLVNAVFNTSISSSATSGNLQMRPVKGDTVNEGYFGPLLSVTIAFSVGSTTGTFNPMISIDLSLKKAS